MNPNQAQGGTTHRATAMKVETVEPVVPEHVDTQATPSGYSAHDLQMLEPTTRRDSTTDVSPNETDSQTEGPGVPGFDGPGKAGVPGAGRAGVPGAGRAGVPGAGRPVSAGSTSTSSDDSSGAVAVEIPSNQRNTEVVLTQSKSGVRKIRVKFTPEHGVNVPRRRRRPRERGASPGVTPERAGGPRERGASPGVIPERTGAELAYPTQVTSPRASPDEAGKSTPPPVQEQQSKNSVRSDSAYVSGSFDREQQQRFTPHPPMPESNRSSQPQPMGSLSMSIGQEIANRIASFEQEYHELSCLLEEAQQNVKELREKNTMYENKILKLEKENNYLKGFEEENESLKLSLERSNQEYDKLQGYFDEEFNLKNKFKEMVIKLEASSEKDIKTLREDIQAKNEELRNMDDALNKAQITIAEHEKKNTQKADKNYNNSLEMITKIENLQDDIKKLTSEKDYFKEVSRKEKAELQNQMKKLEAVMKELDELKQRNKQLRKDYEEKQRELDRLKKRRGSFGSSCSSTSGSDLLKINRISNSANSTRFNQSPPTNIIDRQETNSMRFNHSPPANIIDRLDPSSHGAVRVLKPRPKTCTSTEVRLLRQQQPLGYSQDRTTTEFLPAVPNATNSKK